MALAEYKRKRHFNRTPEPQAKVAVRRGSSYVIQKHDASRLHYDFRLELDGVLKSWAVPKGPSLDPAVKRLAVHVEDHPVDYGEFEGVIPKGEYGGGTVLLWDTGTWEPIGDPHVGYRDGKLKFKLSGQKLNGGWMLVRSGSSRKSSDGNEWLLIKERDDSAQDSEAGDIIEDAPLSVVSNCDLEEIAAARGRVWSSKSSAIPQKDKTSGRHPAPPKSVDKVQLSRLAIKSLAAGTAGAKKTALPISMNVELATLIEELPEGDLWLHEIKFDGYRMLCRIDRDDVRFISRNQQDWTERLKPLVQAVKSLGIAQGMLDGEIVSLRKDGTTDFQALQNAFRDSKSSDIHYYVFDLVYLDGYSLLDVRLEERKRVLAQLISMNRTNKKIHLSEHLSGSSQELMHNACKLHLEGIISKRLDRPYREGRTQDWLKTKCLKHEEFVIGGFTEPAGSRSAFGALLVGYHDDQGELRYSGKVGTGFDQKTLKALLKELTSLGLKSYICVPLAVSGKPLGVLTFATAESGRRYGDADLALATDLAQRAAVAIENTQLYLALREADRRKDEFLATLAHELRNPLAPIRNSLQILKMPRVDAETVERTRDMMERQVHHLVRLVDDLMDVSRVMRGRLNSEKKGLNSPRSLPARSRQCNPSWMLKVIS